MYLITNDYRNVIRLKADIMTKSLQDYTKEELIEQIKSLKKTKKFGLVWEDKPEQVAIDCETKLPVLTEVTERAITKADDQPTNLIIEGDNYHSLSTLNYTHAGKIDVIYVDPPYNTGSKDFIYNDRYVDKEDGFRHSKWLSFMEKRLELAKQLLSPNGVIFISIDDNEQAHLKLLCDDVFNANNFVAPIIVNSNSSKNNSKYIGVSHEYVLVYAKDISLLEGGWRVRKNNVDEFSKRAKQLVSRGLDPEEVHKELLELVKYPRFYDFDHYTYADDGGVFRVDNSGGVKNGNQKTVLTHPVTKKPCAVPDGGWRYREEELLRMASENLLYFGKDEKNIPAPKRYLKDYLSQVPKSSVFFDSQSSTKMLKKMGIAFDFPKATELIEYLISMFPNNEAVTVLDFFAGSGTTGHAVIKLNKKDNGSRKFILCTNNEGGIAENVTYKRISSVLDETPANLRYFKTSFVDKAENTDQTRVALVARATDMIKVRENTFETVLEEDLIKAYEGADTYSVIVFDPSAIDKAKTEIAKLSDNKAVRVYVFSLANDSYVSDFADLDRQVELCPIPESILEVYKRIFDQKGTK